MKKYVAILAICLFLAGCATASSFKPTPSEMEYSNFGPYPSNYEEIIKAYFEKDLIDPYSAVYKFNAPVKGKMAGGPSHFGWLSCGTVNAKNRFGGYVGAKNYIVKIYNGIVVYDMAGGAARQVCEWVQ